MIEMVTRWRASDGKEFEMEAQALNYEHLIQEVSVAMEALGPRCADAIYNGQGFIQHDPSARDACKRRLIVVMAARSTWFEAHQDKEIHLSSMAERILYETEEFWPSGKAWFRLQCIDEEGREWDQPYFVRHPGKMVMVEDRRSRWPMA